MVTSGKPPQLCAKAELVPGQPGQTILLVSYLLPLSNLPKPCQKAGVGSREEAPHTAPRPHFTATLTKIASEHLLSQTS